MNLSTIEKVNVSGKRVFVRADLDVPLSETRDSQHETRKIEDETRLRAVMPTIEYLLGHRAKVIVGGHLGRPEGFDKSLSLEPVAKWLSIKYKVLSIKYGKRGEFDGWEITPDLFILENLRFYKGEEANDLNFAKKLSSLADVYVNDAFAMSHRNHASIVGITKFLPHYAGFHLAKEIEMLGKAMDNPKRPLVVIIGGKKIETKLPLVHRMHEIADYVLVGGKIAQESKVLLKEQHSKLTGKKSVLLVADSNSDKSDITEQDAENFLQIINTARTVIWNGSMGIISEKRKVKSEKNDTERGTRLIAKGIMESGAYSVVGGGDTVEFLNKLGILDKFSFTSTGGGAMLAFLSGEKLPGIEALLNNGLYHA
ncbi:MAG: phosphoglycerate kinase [Candidatus Levybacteria bacterium]|nr:phosphoglycerate kinase [Candidatus Levybacteria bacterium]